MININIKLTIEQFSKSWAIYGVFDIVTNQPTYVGCIRLANLFTLSDLRTNLDIEPTREVMVMVIDIYDKKVDAIIAQSKKIRELQLNIVPKTRGQAVRCITTGETFGSAQEAPRAHNLTYSALSNHLSRKTGYLTVKSKIYERIDNIEHLRSTGQVQPKPYK